MVPKAVGIPDMFPVESIDNPAGRLGLIVNASVPNPPVAVTGWNGNPVLKPCVSVYVEGLATVGVIAAGAATDSMKVFELVCGTTN